MISTADVFLDYFLIRTCTNIYTGKTSIIPFYFQLGTESQSAGLKKSVAYLNWRKNWQIIKINACWAFQIIANPSSQMEWVCPNYELYIQKFDQTCFWVLALERNVMKPGYLPH